MPEPSTSSSRTTKRKLEDAIRTLDDAALPASLAAVERPTPSKRPLLTRSVYSTLVKLGTSSNEQSWPTPLRPHTTAIDISKSAPHLAAIIARSSSQSKPVSHFSARPPAQPASEYRPSSSDSFLSRLATYKITTYANKPPEIDAVAAARCGWINDGKDRLICGVCDSSWVLASRGGMNKDAANALVEKQRVYLVDMHKDGCPWKVRQCDSSIYRVPLLAPAVMIHKLRDAAISLEPLLVNVAIRHPLTASELNSLHFIFATEFEKQVSGRDSNMAVDETIHPTPPSDIAVVAALFGWVPVPVVMRSELSRTSSLLSSRAGTYAPSTSRLPTPSISRAGSVSSHLREWASTPPSASPRMRISQFNSSPNRERITSRMNTPWSDNPATATALKDDSLVHCVLCHRRIGLWRYARTDTLSSHVQRQDASSTSCEPKRVFDLAKEHRSYCPYIVRSSLVPSYSRSPAVESDDSAIEGWQSVLTVVQRFGLSQRQRISRFLPTDDSDNQAPSAELKGIQAMVAGVKTNGGRELLRYVKDLLG